MPLGEPPEQQAPLVVSPVAGEETEGEEASSSQSSRRKDKSRDRDIERREERKELKRVPPPPPPRPQRTTGNQEEHHPEVGLTAACKRHQEESNLTRGKCYKKNKGKKHRERGIAYRAALSAPDASTFAAKAKADGSRRRRGAIAPLQKERRLQQHPPVRRELVARECRGSRDLGRHRHGKP